MKYCTICGSCALKEAPETGLCDRCYADKKILDRITTLETQVAYLVTQITPIKYDHGKLRDYIKKDVENESTQNANSHVIPLQLSTKHYPL